MSDMGNHSLPNGHRGDDGAAAVLPPPAIGTAFQPLRLGPLVPWPDDAAPAAPQTAKASWRASIDGDTVIRWLTAAVVLAVAAFAAVVSYSHIYTLGRLHGQDGTAARLLPLSVDGLIAAASLVMLHAARNKLPVPSLARCMLALGVAATVAANVFYGLPFGWLAAVVSAWPATAFIGSVEMAVRFVSDARSVATGEAEDDARPRHGGWRFWPHRCDIASDTEAGSSSDKEEHDVPPEPAPEQQQHCDTEPASPRRQTSRKARTGSDKARDILRRNPGLAKDVVAKRAGVTVRTVERVISDMEGTASHA